MTLALRLKNQVSKFTSVCAITGALFMWDAYFRMGVYKRNVVVAIKMVPIFMGGYLLWVPIIPILWYYTYSPYAKVVNLKPKP